MLDWSHVSFIFQIGDVNALEGLSCSFENLKDLSLVTTFFTSAILCELCLLKNAPNLEKLTFVVMLNASQTIYLQSLLYIHLS